MLAGSIRHQDECLRRRCGVSCMELSTQEACVCACLHVCLQEGAH